MRVVATSDRLPEGKLDPRDFDYLVARKSGSADLLEVKFSESLVRDCLERVQVGAEFLCSRVGQMVLGRRMEPGWVALATIATQKDLFLHETTSLGRRVLRWILKHHKIVVCS